MSAELAQRGMAADTHVQVEVVLGMPMPYPWRPLPKPVAR